MKNHVVKGILAILLSSVLLLSGCGSSVDKDAILRQLNEAKNELQDNNKEESSSLNEASRDSSSKEDTDVNSNGVKPADTDNEQTSKETAESSQEESVVKPDNGSAQTNMQVAGEQLFSYVKEVLVPQEGMASLEAFTATCEDKESGYESNGALGLLSADIHDYDGDGQMELVTFSVEFEDDANTQLGMLMNYSHRSLVVRARLYGTQNGQVQLLDEAITAQLTKESFGQMACGVRKSSGVYYIYGKSYNEDTTTYGPTPISIYHVEGKKFVYDRIAGRIGWGQSSSPEDANEQLGTRNWDYKDTALADTLDKSLSYRSNQAIPENLGNDFSESMGPSLKCLVYVAYPNSQTSACRNYDFSNLGEILETGYAAYMQAHPFVQEESDVHVVERMEEEDLNAVNLADQIANEIQAGSGVTLTKGNTSETNGIRVIFYTAPGGESMSIQVIMETNKLRTISISTPHYDITDDWIALKDATLNCSLLGLNKGALEGIYGACTNCTDQDAGNGAVVYIGQAVCCVFNLSFE